MFVPWQVFESDWALPNKEKSYVVHPKWPGCRPCASKNSAAKGLQAYLAVALHSASRGSDQTTDDGTRVAVFQKPYAEVRVVGGRPHHFWRMGQGHVIRSFSAVSPTLGREGGLSLSFSCPQLHHKPSHFILPVPPMHLNQGLGWHPPPSTNRISC